METKHKHHCSYKAAWDMMFIADHHMYYIHYTKVTYYLQFIWFSICSLSMLYINIPKQFPCGDNL